MQNGFIPLELWISGDGAYNSTQTLVTPYPRSPCDNDNEDFDSLSSHRVHVKQTFGQVMSKFSILNVGLSLSMDTNIHTIVACIKWHNHCKDICPWSEDDKDDFNIAVAHDKIYISRQVYNPRENL